MTRVTARLSAIAKRVLQVAIADSQDNELWQPDVAILAYVFGVSPATVENSIGRLAHAGWLTNGGHTGWQVTTNPVRHSHDPACPWCNKHVPDTTTRPAFNEQARDPVTRAGAGAREDDEPALAATVARGRREGCSATRRDGQPCKAPAIAGGFVCRRHGGSAAHVRLAAQRRILIEKAIRALDAYDAARGTAREFLRRDAFRTALARIDEHDEITGMLLAALRSHSVEEDGF